MVYSQIPLFGIKSIESVDPFYQMRVIRASNRGTLMEFGIVPIADSLLLLTLFKKINDTPYNHALLSGAKKFLILLQTMVLSVLFIMTGMYGELEQIDVTLCVLICMQLLIAGQIMFLLNGLVEKGYCLGTGISLFMVANICGTIMWKALSPVIVYTDQGGEFEGVLVFLFEALSTKNDTIFFLRRVYFRQNLPNLVNLLATIFVFLIVIYLKGLCVKLPMRSTIHKARWGFFHINFLYTSVFPLIFQSTLVSTLSYFSQILSTKFSENFFSTLLGVWAIF